MLSVQVVVFLLSVSEVISQCPPSSGIYLRHNGTCYTNNGSFFTDGSIRPTPLECALPGATLNGGEWIGPNGEVPCGNGNNQNVQCTTGSSAANLSVFINPPNFLGAPGDGQYMCCLPTSCSTPGTNIITANIFRFVEIESFTVTDLPSDMTVYPQEYKLNCTKIGNNLYDISMSISSTALANYTNCHDPSNNCPGTDLSGPVRNTVRYTVNITWDGMTVSSGSISQSTTGDQMYQCRLADRPDVNEIRIRNVTIKVPATAPSSLTEVNKAATTITVNWTSLNSSDADGYVVNVTSDTDTVQTVQVEGSSNNTITLNGLGGGSTYSITVRAYQQLLGPASSAISVFTHCQQQGIYLEYNGNCYPNGSYFWDSSVNAVTEAISCVLPGTNLTTGQWVRVADPDDPVDCNSNSTSDPFWCNFVTSPDATLNLYLAQGLPAAQEGWYKCCLPSDCSDPNTNIIFATIFRFAEIELLTVADLPSDMTIYPQEYKLNCTKIGFNRYDISMSIGSTALASYTNCYDGSNSCSGTVLVSSTNTVRYTVNITWDGMNVSSGSISQSTTGNQMYQCVVEVTDQPTRTRNVTIKVPATAPSSLTEVNKTTTTITVSWTALDSSDADGYVVNVTSDTDTVQTVQVEGNSNNTITLNGLTGGTTYSITVRAYQQLLGPASTISVQTLPVINSINWTLVSSITQLNNTQYRIDCLTTTDINPSTDVYWLVNGVIKSSSNYSSIDVLTYNNTLLVYPDPLGVSVNVTCIAMIGGVNYSQSVILHAPSGPPNNVRGFILNATSIKVNWTSSSETNGYVIEYTTGGVTRNVVSTSEDEIVLTDLSPMSTYTISVYSYIDLPSVNSTVTVLRFDVPSPVTSLSVSNVSTTGITVNWSIPSSDNYVTYYTISYTPSCPQLSSVNETVSVGPHQSTTTYSYTLIGLYSGMNYTITVRAGNVLGGSELSMSTSAQTEAMIPSGWPSSIQVLQINSTANRFTWNEVNCSQHNGLITGYTVIISNSTITYNLTSTERYIISNDLVFGTEYNISVAAVNSVGRGPFSDPIVIEIGLGIYLKHGGTCYTNNGSFFTDSSIRPSPVLECGLPGATLNGGQWIGPNGIVPCDGGNNQNVQCTTGSGASLSIHINPGSNNAFLGADGDGQYMCCLPTSCSTPGTNIITATIFRFAEIESFTVADLPSDMTVYPQEYKLNCIKIGHNRYGISMSIGSTALATYTDCHDLSNNCPGTDLSGPVENTVRYTVNITWDGMTVSSGSISQSTTGDQMYQCRVADHPGGNEIRIRNVTIKVPATAPSSLTEVNKTTTTITVSWTAVDSSDADGYVVNVTSDTDTVQTVQVEGSSNMITLNGLRELTTYNITVRAYQQLLGPATTISAFTHCQQQGIYLAYNGNCYLNGSYFWDSSVNAVTKAISCVLPGTSLTTGQWVRVADPDDPVDCNSNNASDPFLCTNVTSPDATINLYLAQGLPAAQEGWYKCCLPTDCSDPNTNIIFANIFRFAQIESFTVTDLPSDMTVYPQEYKLNCTKIGFYQYGISMNIGNTALASYTNCDDRYSTCPGTVLVSFSNTVRYTVNITWDGMNVSSGSISQSTAGDQMYQCVLDNPSAGDDRTRNLTITVPATAPSSLTEVSKTTTTITVSWTALDLSDADGYVVNITSDTDTVQTVQVEGSSNNTITLNGLRGGTTYSITVRAYQQLLGPASTISVQTLPVINSINWRLVSSITQLNNTQYCIDCLTTTDVINPSTDVYYGPPNNVRGFILNATSIKVNWTTSSETNGYVIEHTTGGVTRSVVSTSEEEIVLTDLSPMSTYTISVYSYIDLPSVNSTVTVLRFDVPSPVTSLSVSNVSTTGITVNWTIPSSDNYVTYYTISYTPSCPQLSSVNERVSVGPHQSTTTYSYTLIGLYSGMNYTITVRAGNVLGGSELSMSTSAQTKAMSCIYLRHNGTCYTNNGSYFTDGSIRPTPLECVLPGATLNGGQWIGPNGEVPCGNGNNQNVQCTTGSAANLSVFINPPSYLGVPGDGQYMCCLPTNCSTPGTNIITATIFRFAEIESFTVADLPSDMTVYPQEYKLNCTKIGFFHYDIRMSIGSTALANYTNCLDFDNNCGGTVLNGAVENTVRYTVNITWDGMNVSSGSISQSTTGDQMYQCRLADHPDVNEIRMHNVTIKGIYLAYNGNCYPNGSFFWDSSVNAVIKAISCVLPGTSLTTGQWVRVADPDDPVDCNSNSASDPFRCTNVTSPDTNISLYLAQGLSAAQEGWYKCCLPTDCSDLNTNIIFANIF
uniref:Fibronectin type-III domain-containing protein n=1 Tax=Amphimedon queenslandica TaxID=400682 RepID=A0A1X7VP27_AMPQE